VVLQEFVDWITGKHDPEKAIEVQKKAKKKRN